MPRRLALISGFLAFLAACGEKTLKEISVELDLSKLRALFDAIRPLVAKGFGEPQMAKIENDFRALQMDEIKEYTFPIVHEGEDSELRVVVRKEDVDTVEIRFFAVPKLTQQISNAMRTAALDVAP